MSNDEILMRIAMDADNLAHYRSIKDVVIGITYGLFKRLLPRLSPKYFALHDRYRDDKMTLFGCEVKILSGKEEWWIVGYLGSTEDGST